MGVCIFTKESMMVRKKFSVKGMTCSSCSAHVEHDVGSVKGVFKVEVSLMANTMIVDYDETLTNDEEIMKAVSKGGYSASIYVRDRGLNQSNQKEGKMKLKKLIASIILMIILMYFSMGQMLHLPTPGSVNHLNSYLNAIIQLIILIPIIILNFHYFTNGFKRLFKLSPNMDSLIALGSSVSFFYGIYVLVILIIGKVTNDHDLVMAYHMKLYFESAGMILTLVSLGKYFENRSKRKTTEAISKLLALAPETALILKDGQEVEINIDDIKIGDIILVKPGTNIPIDGIVVDGKSSVDEASLTGEAIPILKEANSIVRSGTINLSGILKIKATCESNDTTLQKIVDLVEVASTSKAKVARLADKISLYFVPVVIGIALVTFIIWMLVGKPFEFSLTMAISVLVISCPCSLGLATPVAIMVGTYKAVSYGILIKSSESLETLHKVDTIILDKTGTITYGKPVVTDLISYQITKDELLKIAYSLEKNSEHPLAYSINSLAKKENIIPYEVTNFTNLLGQGVTGIINQKTYYCGTNIKNLSLEKTNYDNLTKEGKKVIIVSTDENVLGLIALKDEVKPTSIKAIKQFKDLNIKVVMLTGDNHDVASLIANECGIDEVVSDVMPEGKASVVQNYKDKAHTIAMVGDGINDSVALTMADVGIAMGSGTDIAIESAEIVLMKDNLEEVATAIKLSKKVLNNIKMNLFWAFFYNCLFIPIAAGVLYPFFKITLNPMLCALAMSLSSICVVLNALRINTFKKEGGKK